MAGSPRGREVTCPHCGATAVAIVPANSTIVEEEAESDGLVRVNCHRCGDRFRCYFRNPGDDSE